MNPVVMMDLQKFHSKAFQLFEQHKNVFMVSTIRENLERLLGDEGAKFA